MKSKTNNLLFFLNGFYRRTYYKVSLKKLYNYHRTNNSKTKSSELILDILNLKKTAELKQQVIDTYETIKGAKQN